MNGFDYSNDNITFGFYDPYVIDAQPRLIATDGSTRVKVKGLGFVNSGETKVRFENQAVPIKCSQAEGGTCVRPADFIDKNHIITDTIPQHDLFYVKDNTPVMWDPFHIEASVYNEDFTDNRVALYYYEDPKFETYTGETPCNIQEEIFIKTTIMAHDLANVRKFATPKARFSTED